MAGRAKAPKRAAKGKVRGKAIATLPKGTRKRRMGDNSKAGGVPEEIKLRHVKVLEKELRELNSLQADVKQQNGIYRNARKLAKKEGLNLKAFDIKRELEALDMGQVHQDYADAAELLRITDSP